MTETRKHRSVSQVNSYERCPHAYYLSRVAGVWQRPAAWLGQGSAVHEAAEQWEKSGRTMTVEQAQDVFRESYAKHINQACETTPNLDWWFSSGPYSGEIDIPRRFEIGLEQVQKYIDWYTERPAEVIWIAPDGTPGIELGFDVELGNTLVRGFIDVIRQVDGELRVIDVKTGTQPGGDFQLGTYAVSLAQQFDIEPPKVGTYWMGRTGKETYPYDLTEWTHDRVSEKFAELDENVLAERFDPKPDPKTCNFCDVQLSCQYRAD